MKNEAATRVPKGNAQIDDNAWLRDEAGDWIKGWRVVTLGLVNVSGHPRNIEIEHSDGARRVVAPFDDDILLLPQRHELSDAVMAVLNSNPNLAAVRDPCNSDDFCYKLFCSNCYELVQQIKKTTEVFGIVYRNDGWDQTKSEQAEDLSEVHCDCRIYYIEVRE